MQTLRADRRNTQSQMHAMPGYAHLAIRSLSEFESKHGDILHSCLRLLSVFDRLSRRGRRDAWPRRHAIRWMLTSNQVALQQAAAISKNSGSRGVSIRSRNSR